MDRYITNPIPAKTVVKVAELYSELPHLPMHDTYRHFRADVIRQYRLMVDSGVIVEFTPGTLTGSSRDLFSGLDSHRKMTIAVDGSPFAWPHPLQHDLNSEFRAVHDFYGHYLGQFPFESFSGELGAYRAHKRLFSPESVPALFGETIGQLCYFFYFGEFVPLQKCVIYPQEIMRLFS